MLIYVALIDEEADKQRFETIYLEFRKQMLYVATCILKNSQDAEDAVQDALLGLAKNIKSVPSDALLCKNYVLISARNAALNQLTKRNRIAYMEFQDAQPSSAQDELFDRVAACQDVELLMRALRRMDTPYQEVLVLEYLHGLSTREIASQLHRKEVTVRKQRCRGKQILIQLCKEEGMDFD
ncbi:MAG TPA: sigma-70 family RNA polymerase sigma factor [Candidatus Faecousia intestinigallinarum]|nr:sigma-70 family RNA polymerase sigma factor [Candidatus Faecousia intestinigallinarum]